MISKPVFTNVHKEELFKRSYEWLFYESFGNTVFIFMAIYS